LHFLRRQVMKMNSAILLGSLTGAMPSTPSLNMVASVAKSDVSALGYAGHLHLCLCIADLRRRLTHQAVLNGAD